jgi:HEAT repeat protein
MPSGNVAPPMPQDLERLAAGLEDLKRGPEAQLRLIACGPAAIAPLARFLAGPPGLHPQPRMLAAQALGAIGGPEAVQALGAALVADTLDQVSPAVRLSEEAVRATIASELGALGDRSAIGPLLVALRRWHLVAAGEALLGFGESRAIPSLVEALRDPFSSERASRVLVGFGDRAVPALVAVLAGGERVDGRETPPSVEQRRHAARLLGTIGDPRSRPALTAALGDETPEVRTAAAIALSADPSAADPPAVVPVLVEAVGAPDWFAREDASEALLRVGPAAVDPLVRRLVDGAATGVPLAALHAVARTLARLGSSGAAALAALARHEHPIVRGLALAHVPAAQPAGRALLERARHDPEPRVRRTAEARLRSREERRRHGA